MEENSRKQETRKADVGREQAPEQTVKSRREPCSRCSGTGLVCGHIPVISPGSCCVDYANAVCPDCGGAGVEK